MVFTPDNMQNVELKMWEAVFMPESVPVQDSEGKTSYKKTGNKVEMTKYSFRDTFGTVLELQSKNNEYRSLEGEMVSIQIDISKNDFPGAKVKMPIKLLSVRKADAHVA